MKLDPRQQKRFTAGILLLIAVCLLLFYDLPRGDWDYSLLQAVRRGDVAGVRISLKKGANPEARVRPKNALLLRLLPYTPEQVAEAPEKEPTALMLAAKRGNLAVTKALLEGGARADAKDKTGGDVAAWAGGNREIAVLLQEWSRRQRGTGTARSEFSKRPSS